MKKDTLKSKVHKKIEKAMGRPPINAKEKRVQAATADFLAGDKITEIEKRYAVQAQELSRYLKKAFPDDEDRFKFLEEMMITNATLAAGRFQDVFGEMNAEQAARAAGIFAGKAIEIKKARESGFKEQPVNVGVILQLQETLNRLSTSPNSNV